MRIENSFLHVDGVGPTTERRLWEHGSTHWDEFDGSGVGSTLADRIERTIAESRRRLEDGDIEYFARTLPSKSCWRLYENVTDTACCLDIETTGLDATQNVVTTVSLHQGGETTTLVRGRDLTERRLASALDDADLLLTFNGSQFDVPFLETTFDLTVSIPHLDLMYPCHRLGLYGGLKQIEQDLGIARNGPDITGRDAVRLWHEYERGEESALDQLVTYNRADTENLVDLADIVTTRLHETVFPDVEDA